MDDLKKFRAALKDAAGIAQKTAIPVPYDQRFEGRRVFDDELFAEFVGCEFVCHNEDIQDGYSVIGDEISAFNDEKSHDIAIFIEVSGPRFMPDYEAVLERDLYRVLNYADGIKHKGQRDSVVLRISKQAAHEGVSLSTIALLIYEGLKSEYERIIENLNVQIITDSQRVAEICAQAKKAYKAREDKLKDLKDKDVDSFCSCTICQSNSPHHVCIISPERTGACGSYDYFSARASATLNPFGPNRIVKKGRPEGMRPGQWEGINDFVYEATHGKLEELNLYSIVDNPPPFSDCMECISALIPSINGVVVLDRRYTGMTPLGMNFAETQDCIHKGASVTGLMGHARVNLTQPGYLKYEGNLKRVVWMPSILKKEFEKEFDEIALQLNEPTLLNKIADETVSITEEETVAYCREQDHPFFDMPPVI